MLKNKENLLLTEEECNLIDTINCDNSSGRHLLSERSDEYWKMRVVVEEARLHRNLGQATEKELQMLEYMKQDSDYEYWHSLPDDKKLFVEEMKTNNKGCGTEFPHFGANYPDARCINGYLWDMDSYDDGYFTIGGDDPCPFCNTEEWLKDVLDSEIFSTREDALKWVEEMKKKYK